MNTIKGFSQKEGHMNNTIDLMCADIADFELQFKKEKKLNLCRDYSIPGIGSYSMPCETIK